MAVAFEQEAIQFTPPRGFGSGEVGATDWVATGAASSTPRPLFPAPVAGSFSLGRSRWYTFVATEDCHIRFGSSEDMDDCTTGDWPLFKGQEMSRLCVEGVDTFFNTLQQLTGGRVYYYPSNR